LTKVTHRVKKREKRVLREGGKYSLKAMEIVGEREVNKSVE